MKPTSTWRCTCGLFFLSHLYIMGFCVDFFRELGQGVLGFQYEVVSIILVVDTADHIQNDCTQYTATGL